MNQNQPIIDVLKNSNLYRQIEAESDAERMAGHRAALDQLGAHLRATSPKLEEMGHALKKAAAELASAAATYERARAAHAHAAWELQQKEFYSEAESSRLAKRRDECLPAGVAELERALILIRLDITAAWRSKTAQEPMISGGSREIVSTNQAELDRAQDAREKIEQFCKSLRTTPRSTSEIVETLRDYLGELRTLARAVGIEIDGRLPKPFTGPVVVERVRDPKIGYAIQNYPPRRRDNGGFWRW